MHSSIHATCAVVVHIGARFLFNLPLKSDFPCFKLTSIKKISATYMPNSSTV